MKPLFAVSVILLSLGPLATRGSAEEWYESTPAVISNVSPEACETMMSGLTRWFTKSDPFALHGHPATLRLYASLAANSTPSDTGLTVIETHTLNAADGLVLSHLYANEASAHVPYLLQLSAAALPVAVGTGLTLLDWMVSSGTDQATANDVAVLITSGGTLTRSYAVVGKDAGKPWLLVQITFGTTVNGQAREYLVCSSGYPLKT